ncbi:MFS transporter [Porticoccaceae bacterium]|nr:MFS transporter [Porticoccaceae bacterium]
MTKSASSSVTLDTCKDTLSTSQNIAYALPAMSNSFILGPVYLIQGIYAMYFGLSLTTIGTVLFLSRLFDAITDPLIGHISDRLRNRRAFIVCGGILMIISAYFLLVPVDPASLNASTKVSEMYFLLCFFTFYLSQTLFDIPHMAWGSELAKTSDEKNSIFAWRSAALYFGALLFYCVPFLPVFKTREITPHTLQWAAIIGGFLMLMMLLVSMRTLHDRGKNERPSMTPKPSLAMFLANKPLRVFMIAFLLSGISFGLFGTMFFIFVSSYLNQGTDYALIMVVSTCASILGIKIWMLLATRWEKSLLWSVGMGFMMIGVAVLAALVPEDDNFPLLLTAYVVVMFGISTTALFGPSILSEIIDYSRWKYKSDCSATFFSLFTFVGKANFALGGALGFLVAGWYGFDPAGLNHSAEAIFGLRLAAIWLPTGVGLISIIFIALIPMNKRRHATIRRYLDSTSARSKSLKHQRASIQNTIDENPLASLA